MTRVLSGLIGAHIAAIGYEIERGDWVLVGMLTCFLVIWSVMAYADWVLSATPTAPGPTETPRASGW